MSRVAAGGGRLVGGKWQADTLIQSLRCGPDGGECEETRMRGIAELVLAWAAVAQVIKDGGHWKNGWPLERPGARDPVVMTEMNRKATINTNTPSPSMSTESSMSYLILVGGEGQVQKARFLSCPHDFRKTFPCRK